MKLLSAAPNLPDRRPCLGDSFWDKPGSMASGSEGKIRFSGLRGSKTRASHHSRTQAGRHTTHCPVRRVRSTDIAPRLYKPRYRPAVTAAPPSEPRHAPTISADDSLATIDDNSTARLPLLSPTARARRPLRSMPLNMLTHF